MWKIPLVSLVVVVHFLFFWIEASMDVSMLALDKSNALWWLPVCDSTLFSSIPSSSWISQASSVWVESFELLFLSLFVEISITLDGLPVSLERRVFEMTRLAVDGVVLEFVLDELFVLGRAPLRVEEDVVGLEKAGLSIDLMIVPLQTNERSNSHWKSKEIVNNPKQWHYFK